jgi:hypothetical protein
MKRWRRRVVSGLLTVVLFAPSGQAAWEEIPISIASPPKLETKPGEKTLVARARANDHERIDIGMEITRWLRREIARGTALAVLDVPPPALPEQRLEVMAVNDTFFRRLGAQFRADLIVAAVAELKVEDRSGFVTRDFESPVTGQMVRSSEFQEQKGYRLELDLVFLKGANGAFLLRESMSEERIVEAQYSEDLDVLFQLLELMKDDLLAVLRPTKVQEPRFVWVE